MTRNPAPWYEKAKAVMKARGISYRALADILGVEKATVGHWMVGRYNPNIHQIQRVAKVLGMTIGELCGESENWISDPAELELLKLIRKATATDLDVVKRILETAQDSKTRTENNNK